MTLYDHQLYVRTLFFNFKFHLMSSIGHNIKISIFNPRFINMDNKSFKKMSVNFPRGFRVKLNPRVAVQRGAMVGWVGMLTMGAAAGLGFAYCKVFYQIF